MVDVAHEQLALMVMDMQVDFCSPDGVFGRHGFDTRGAFELVPRIAQLMGVCRSHSIPIVATLHTVRTGQDGRAVGVNVAASRQFLATEGFRDGSPGQALVPELPTVDYVVKKWGPSTMYQTDVERVLRWVGATTIVFVGVATSGAVEATARQAVARGFGVVVVEDCVAAYEKELHEAALRLLRSFAEVCSAKELITAINRQD